MSEAERRHAARRWAFALEAETEEAGRLLLHGTALLRDYRFFSTDAAPLLAVLSTGAEKMLKLTFGLNARDETGSWPEVRVMKGPYSHRILDLDTECRAIFSRRLTTPYLRGLLSGVEHDRKLSLVLAVLDRYAKTGRFFNLDLLADAPQPRPSPEHLWQEVESEAEASDADTQRLLADLSGDSFDEGRRRINRALADSLDAWRELYFRAWINGVIGAEAKRYAGRLDPNFGSRGRAR